MDLKKAFKKITISSWLWVYVVVNFFAGISLLIVRKSEFEYVFQILIGIVVQLIMINWFKNQFQDKKVSLKDEIKNSPVKEARKDIFLGVIFQILFTFTTLIIPIAMSSVFINFSGFKEIPVLEGDLDIPLYSNSSIFYNVIIFILSFITTTLLAPLEEELTFRGMMFKRFNIKRNAISSILISTLIFTFGHAYLNMPSTFLFGINLSIIYLKYSNIFIPMLIHGLYNLIITFIDIGIYIYFKSTRSQITLGELLNIILFNNNSKTVLILAIIILITSGILFVIYMIREYKKLDDSLKSVDPEEPIYRNVNMDFDKYIVNEDNEYDKNDNNWNKK